MELFKKFKFSISDKDKKENYDYKELNTLLEQQRQAMSGHVEQEIVKRDSTIEQLEKTKVDLENKNKKYFSDFQKVKKEEVAKKVNFENYEKLLKHVSISEKDSETEIERKFVEFSKDFFSDDEDSTSEESKKILFQSNINKKGDEDDKTIISPTTQWKEKMNNSKDK